MNKYLQIILSLIKRSILNTHGKESSTRITSYIIGSIIVLFCLVFIGIELSSAIIALHVTGKYVISSSILIVFSSLLAHQLTLLGINKYHESKNYKVTMENGGVVGGKIQDNTDNNTDSTK